VIIWGKPALEDAVALCELLPFVGSPLAKPLARYFDIRAVETVEQAVFADLANRPVAEALVTRLAVVYRGPLGATLGRGFPIVASMPERARFFEEPAPALSWAGVPSSGALARELDELTARCLGTTLLVRELRAYLASHLHDGDLAAAAHALGHSPRSLQRRLRDEATSFQRELDHVRIEAAKALLARDVALDEVATRVGTSRRNLEALFRRLVGDTPGDWTRSE
jgi:AraC-like DNA-binding protein